MNTKYYTIEEIKELGNNKITEIIKNNILNSKNKDFIINLTITYNDANNISLFGDHDWNETIFGDNIYTYGGIFYNKNEKNYIIYQSKRFLNYMFNINDCPYKFFEDIYNNITNNNISIDGQLLFIYNNNTNIKINEKTYDLYNNLNLLFNNNNSDYNNSDYNNDMYSYILPNTKINLSLKLHELSSLNFELKDNLGNYELRLYINSIELPTNEFTDILIKKTKKTKKYKNYFCNYIYFNELDICKEQIIKNNIKINKLKENNLNDEKIKKIEIINNKIINFLNEKEKELEELKKMKRNQIIKIK